MSTGHVQDAVREKYGEIARSVGKGGCCGPSSCGCGDPITSNLYSDSETNSLPADAVTDQAPYSVRRKRNRDTNWVVFVAEANQAYPPIPLDLAEERLRVTLTSIGDAVITG